MAHEDEAQEGAHMGDTVSSSPAEPSTSTAPSMGPTVTHEGVDGASEESAVTNSP
jgi:hypothetical protein